MRIGLQRAVAQRFVVYPQGVQRAVAFRQTGIRGPIHGVFGKKTLGSGHPNLLAGIYQRNSAHQHRRSLGGIGPLDSAKFGDGRRVPCRLVVVRRKAQSHRGRSIGFGRIRGKKIGDRALSRSKYLLQIEVPVPAVDQWHSGIVVVGALAFGQKQQLAVGDSFEVVHCGLPKHKRNIVRRIKAESVNTHLKHPVLHLVNHCQLECGVGEVQVGDILPVGSGGMHYYARRIGGVPLGVLRDPRMVPGGVVGHPIDNDGHFAVVGLGDQGFEVLQSSEFGVDGSVVRHTVGRSDGLDLPHFKDGHQPNSVDIQ